ncbi:MAG: hypothetical protein WCJ07_14385, partial [Verrucomicrobiota bacterium]
MEDFLNRLNRNFVSTFLADVFGRTGIDIHFLTAPAMKQACEHVNGLRAERPVRLSRVQSIVAFFPQHFGDNWLDGGEYPFRFWFWQEFAHAVAVGVIRAIQTLGRGVLQKPQDSRVGELAAISCAVTLLIKHPRDAFPALVLG